MRITKRQLKRIIKEEKQKLLKETIADMVEYEELIGNVATQISDKFGEDMMMLYDEEPEAFAVPSQSGSGMTQVPKDVWQQQVVYAQQELDSGIVSAISRVIEQVEMQLHDGQYLDER